MNRTFLSRALPLALATSVPWSGCTALPVPTPADAGLPPDAGTYARDACKSSLLDTPQVIIGHGQFAFMDLADNQVLRWEPGPQGGHHVWVSLRLRGVRQSGTVVTLALRDVESPAAPVLLTERPVVFDLRRDEGGYCALVGLRLQVDEIPGVAAASLAGHHAVLAVTVDDPEGAHATASRIIVLEGALPDAGVGADAGSPPDAGTVADAG